MNRSVSSVLKENCGVFGICGLSSYNAGELVFKGLRSLQHRGQDSAGIHVYDDNSLKKKEGKGCVSDVFYDFDFSKLSGRNALGHVRYATSGERTDFHCQPMSAKSRYGDISIAHNGNLTNCNFLNAFFQSKGIINHSGIDTEFFLCAINSVDTDNLSDALIEGLRYITGAYALVIMNANFMLAARDFFGIRPLSLGRMPDGAPVLASESCAFSVVGASMERDILPGEIISFNTFTGEERTIRQGNPSRGKSCIFEAIYFARPESTIDNVFVYEARKKMGAALAKIDNLSNVDAVIPVLDSGGAAGLGYANASGFPFEMALRKNPYASIRTFINPTQKSRECAVRLKHTVIKEVVFEKKVVLVDDSLVRGTTISYIAKIVREAGAREIHIRIACPPIIEPCFFGIDTPDRDKLVSHNFSPDQLAKKMNVDSLMFLPLDKMLEAVNRQEFCYACFTGNYPENIDPDFNPTLVERN